MSFSNSLPLKLKEPTDDNDKSVQTFKYATQIVETTE